MNTWLIESNIVTTILVVTQSVLLAASLFAIFRLARKQSSHNKQLNQIKNELKAIISGNVGIGRKINLVSKEIASVELDKMTNAQVSTEDKNYQQASVLLKRGASVEEVVDACDIAPDEAELLSIMTHANDVVRDAQSKPTKRRALSSDFSLAS